MMRMLPHVPLKLRILTLINAFLNTIMDTSKVGKYRMESVGYETVFKFAEEVKGSNYTRCNFTLIATFTPPSPPHTCSR